jgi:Flp pilus assembly pilin Flp
MSEFILRKTVGAHVALSSASNMLASYAHQAAERFRREQTGQDLIEYGGVLAIIALVIGALYATGFWTTISSAITTTAGNIVSGKGTPPK